MDSLFAMDETSLQIPGNCPALIIYSFSQQDNLIAKSHIQKINILHEFTSWLFPTFQEHPLPDDRSYCKKRFF